MRNIGTIGSSACLLLAAACQPGGDGAAGSPQAAFDGISETETIRLTGTEPFWGGTVQGDRFVYTTLEDQAGAAITVNRFAGNSGLGFSGALGGQPIDLMVTRGSCSDGMSDRTYPYTATLRLGSEQQAGCAWTDRQPFTGPANP